MEAGAFKGNCIWELKTKKSTTRHLKSWNMENLLGSGRLSILF
jgi:hypothetical protein